MPAVLPVLATLPTEILRQIFSSLHRLDLIEVSLVSRRLHSIASSLLYTHVLLSASTIHRFVCTILAREDHAEYVKNIRFKWPQTGSHKWYALQVSLLMHLLPNIHILDCTPPGAMCEVFELFNIFCEGQLSSSLPIGLQSVREICSTLNWNQPEYEDSCQSLTTLLAMMTLPSIRKIQVHMAVLDPLNDFGHLCTAYAGKSHVTSLEMVDGYMSPSTLQQILLVPRALTHFSYCYNSQDQAFVDYLTFGNAIRQVRATLEYLELCFWVPLLWDESGNTVDVAVSGSIGSLRNWPRLTRIRSPLVPLLGMPNTPRTLRLGEVLPKVIRELVVDLDSTWTMADVAGEIIYLTERKEAYGLTQLVDIKLGVSILPDLKRRKRLRVACAAAGIRFRVVSYDWVTEVLFMDPE